MTRITAMDVLDVRFPTSRNLDGSDAMNPDPDYSAAYVIVRTSDAGGPEGHGLTFTIGRGTEVVVAAVEALRPLVVGRRVEELFADMGAFWRTLVGDSQLRWIGPEKGVIHLATAAVVNAVWDLFAKTAGKPLWKLVCDMTPEEIVALVDFRYISDALPPERALDRLRGLAPSRAAREAELRRDGYPAYSTSVGWLGYDDDKIRRLCREALAEGWTAFKLKVGADVDDDRRRAAIVREEIGPDRIMAVDANQRWGVAEAIAWMDRLREFDPYWIEEPTSPDDILGHAAIARGVAPIRVATGEHVHNRVMFKQLFQAQAIGVCQIDSCRLGGVNEVLAVLLMAAEFGVPVCPHAGGVGLCELVQHLSVIDYVCVSGSLEGRMIEYVDHLHEHFVDPVVIRDARYVVPARPGYSAEILPSSLARYRFPDGEEWRAIADEVAAAAASSAAAGPRADVAARRFGQRIRVKPEAIEEYERIHAAVWPGVLEQIRRSNIRNYTIWRDGEDLIAYFEYVGDDFEADMAAMAADPETQRWWKLTDAMQEPLPDRDPGAWWKTLREVFHTD